MVFIGLGSNLNDPVVQIRRALKVLAGLFSVESRCSNLWRSSPLDCPAGAPDFINAVMMFESLDSVSPKALLKQLQKIERGFGRTDSLTANQPRVLDLDLIAFGQQVITGDEGLNIPHPRAHKRHFVLVPMAELAPNFVWPDQQGKTVAQLLEQLPQKDWGVPVG